MTMKILQLADQVRYRTMTTAELRATFLIEDLFQAGRIDLVYIDLDRAVVGSAVPLAKELTLGTYPALRAEYFTERRELGVFNIGCAGRVTVDGKTFELGRRDALYIGRGSKEIVFASNDAQSPAEFYLLSYPAHAAHPAAAVSSAEQEPTRLGAPETANQRAIYKLIYAQVGAQGAKSCQLVMGFTQLAAGSVWNTMPAHTHMRRSEIYLYFDLPENERVLHLMGPAHETRHLMVANKQVAISPLWSIHAGAGTASYAFCWGMGGENQAYDDMDRVETRDLR
ncbi:MAG: 5-dehydro-4-deoxy-D-glucuronate isomerase [Terracidiphilus sp.]